jgi:hypothetical protein
MKRIQSCLSPAGATALLVLFWISGVFAETVFVEREFQGSAEGTPAVPLLHIEGTLSNTPAITGSVTIHLQFEGSGDLRALFIDQGTGLLAGMGLGAMTVQGGTGSIDYATGHWSVDFSPNGMVGSFRLAASYQVGVSEPSQFREMAERQTASFADPLIKLGGGLAHSDVQPGTLLLTLRRMSDSAVMGIYCDAGAGVLTGATFLNSNLPEFSAGTLNVRNGAWILDIPQPGLSEAVAVEAIYSAADGSWAALDETVGVVAVPTAEPLLKIGGWLTHPHPVPGSVTFFLRSRTSGRLIGAIEDSTGGSLSGEFLFASLTALPVQGFMTHSTGGWFADLAMPGADQDLDIRVSYLYSNGPPRKVVNSPRIIEGFDAAPLISFAGQALGAPLRPGSVGGWVYQAPDNRLRGTFRDLGDGRLEGRYLFQGIVPVSIQGRIDYSSGGWSVSMPYPGFVGTGSVWVCSQTAFPLTLPWDFNGDWHSDLAIVTNGIWSAQSLAGSNLFHDIAWGWSGAVSIYGDYDGDSINDWSVYDPVSGDWYILSLTGSVVAWEKNWGYPGAIPVPGDYDRDGIYDYAVFGAGEGRWYLLSSVGSILGWDIQWGWPGATPVSGDFDGDGIYDLAVFDPATGHWYIRSCAGPVLTWSRQWGWPGARVVPGDYDGDNRWDLAVFNDQTGRWYIQSLSGDILVWNLQWGWQGAIPVTGDFDGDGAFDLAVYNADTQRWYIMSLTAGVVAWER